MAIEGVEEEAEKAGAGLARLLEQHRAELTRFLAARCGSQEEAEDLVQELWLKAAATPSGPIANGRSYLFRMANNLVLDQARGRMRSMRRDHVWLENEGGGAIAPEERADGTEPVDDAIARRQEAAALREAIETLPQGAQRALRLYRFEGLGQSEIAEIMGISRSGVEKHLALAMRRLRDALADCGSFSRPASDHERPDRNQAAEGTGT